MIALALILAQEDLIPPEVPPDVVVAWSPVVAVPLIAGVVEVLVRTGLPLRFSSLSALVIGVAGGVASAVSTDVVMLTGIIQGAVMGLAASGLWMHYSSKVNTNGA